LNVCITAITGKVLLTYSYFLQWARKSDTSY
jgi:hypothetical protein